VLFFIALLEERARDETLVRLGRWAAFAGLVTGVLAALDQLVPIWFSDKLLNLAFIACNLAIIAGIVVAVRRRSRMVWYYLAAWLPVLLVFNLRIARNLGLAPQSDWVDFASFIAIGFEVVLLSLAIADRVRSLNRDYAAAEIERAALRGEALTDALTGVRNRAYFQRCIDAIEETGEPVDLVLVDIDYLKDTNDFAGHDAGDQLLKAAAETLLAAADCIDCVARVGGDEFAVILSGERRARLGPVLDSIRRVGTITTASGQLLPLSMSAGHATWEPEQGFPGRLFKEADLALYQAKAAGRAGWRTYDSNMRDEEDSRRRTVMEARTALVRGEFFLAFQPVYSFKPEELLSNEVLLRWRHPAQGVLTPAQFLPVIEEPTLLAELQDLVLDKALDAVRADPSLRRVSVNFVASQLQGVTAAERIFEKLASRGLPADRLIVEIRESVLLGRVVPGSPIELCLQRLRWAGVSVALDDFGTGGASLVHLQALPIDILKIDVSLIAAITGDRATARVVASIIDLAHGFGRQVIAEGIETEQQLAALKRAGCDGGQGHLLGRPIDGKVTGRLSLVAS
jgi:diguanylate cyclase (GGDEF)-like protein